MKPSLTMINVVLAITFVCICAMFVAAAHADEQGTHVTVVSTNPQAQAFLKDCTPLSTTAYACVLTSAQVDDLTGYVNVVVLAHHTFIPSISR